MTLQRGAFDFEAYDWVKPRCIGIMWGTPDARHWEFIRHDTDFMSVAREGLLMMHDIAEKGGPKEWHAFNGGRYDVLFILRAIADLGWVASGFGAGGRLISVTTRPPNTKHAIKLCDSQAIVPGALKRAAKDFDLKSHKTLTDADYSVDVRKWTPEVLETGCKADCEVLLELLEKVEAIAENFGGEMKVTFSSTAMSILKNTAEVLDTERFRGANETARLAYHGGRVEILQHIPLDVLSEWDINSSYPWSMSQDLPFRFVGHVRNEAASKAWQTPHFYSVVDATVNVPKDTALPVLPWKHADGGMFFPTGQWRGWFIQDELQYAVETGYAQIVKLHSALLYTREAPYKDFVDKLFELKRTAKGALRNFAKLMLNGCYGKFGQHPEKESLKICATEEEAHEILRDKANRGKVRAFGADVRFLSMQRHQWSNHTHYALAAAITARSRVLLHKYLSAAKSPAYCDTDSVHASCESVIETSDLLGGMKLEQPRLTAKYYAPKIYELHPEGRKSHYASKGFPIDEASFKKVVRGEYVASQRMQLYKRQLRNENEVRRTADNKHWNGKSMKRRPLIHTKNGETVPWSVEELMTDTHLESYSPIFMRGIFDGAL